MLFCLVFDGNKIKKINLLSLNISVARFVNLRNTNLKSLKEYIFDV
jgi:hypothetical protein